METYDKTTIFKMLSCLRLSCVTGIFFLHGCMFVPKPTPEELRLLDNPPADITGIINQLTPAALAWYELVEKQLHPSGRSLTLPERQLAFDVGISSPDDIRVVILKEFPMPGDPVLRGKAATYGLGSSAEGARTMGNIIMIKPDYQDSSVILSHELVHVAQHERLGREGFIRRYITEMEIMGYARSPLELEAYQHQKAIHTGP